MRMQNTSPKGEQLLKFLVRLLVLLAIVIIVVGALIYGGFLPSKPNHSKAATQTPTPTRTQKPTSTVTGTVVTPTNAITISNGSYALDTNRSDGILKLQASTDFRQGNTTAAQSLWDQAIKLDSNDAEAFIYLEDLRIATSQQPYITFVVATTLTGRSDDVSSGRDDLQGAYITQQTYNKGFMLPGGTQVRLLIANSGDQPQDATTIAQQIVTEAQQDKTIVGVMGWPFSEQTANAVSVLTNAHIPIVSPTASNDDLSGISPYFFRVCPPNQVQAMIGVQYATQELNAKTVALFVDTNNSYSQNLASDFSEQFTRDGGKVVDTENYTVGDPTTLPGSLQKALAARPDLIYFAGYAGDMSVLLTSLQTTDPNLQIMGGDRLYEVNAYPPSAHANYYRLRMTAFAFPDTWKKQGYPNPTFFDTYSRTFDPDNLHANDPYDYSRPDSDVILSYDAMLALLTASNNALANGETSLTTDTLEQNLQALKESQAVQGISGQIAFDSNGNPVNKSIVILSVNSTGFTQIVNIQPCFLKEQCD